MITDTIKNLKYFIVVIIIILLSSCPNNEMRDLVEIKVSDPVADTFIINSGAPTASRTVILNSIVTKEEDALEMRFKNEGYEWSDWESYSPTKTWELSFLDGAKIVSAEYRDQGHHVVSMENNILLNTGAPAGDFYIYGNGLISVPAEDNQHEYTNTRSVKLCISIANVAKMRFSNNPVADNNTAWDSVTPLIPFSEEYDWTLTSIEGEKIIYAQFVTNSGTSTYSTNSPVDSHQPYLDTSPPIITNLLIEGGTTDPVSSISVDFAYDISETIYDSEHKMWAEYRNDGESWKPKVLVSGSSITVNNWILKSEIGTRTVYVRLSDIAGNLSSVYSDTIFLDNAAPSIPSPTAATPTNNLRPTWTWAAIPGAENYRCYFPDFPTIEIGNVTTFTPENNLFTNQSHTFYLQAEDSAGNWSAAGTHTIYIDTDVPSAPTGLDLATADDAGSSSSDNITNKTAGLTISGNAEANSTVTIYNNTTLIATTNADATGYFSADIDLTGDGVKSIRARCSDAAGNLSSDSTALSITIDTTAPTAPSTPDLSAADDQGTSNSDNITNQTSSLTFSGTAESGSTVTIYDNTTVKGSFTATSGSYSVDITLSAGNRNIRATATDIAGNISGYSSGLSVTIDTTAPTAPSTPNLSAADDQGSSNTDNITNQTSSLTFSGTAESGSTVTIYDNTTVKGAFAAPSGSYSGDITLSAGNRNIRATATDIAGNISGYSSGLSVTIDITAPLSPSVNVDPFNAGSATWSWSSTGAARYRYRLNNTNLASEIPTTSGSVTISSGLTAGNTHSLYVQAEDTAGNWSGISSDSTLSYAWLNSYTNSLVIGSQNFGGRTTDTVGAGQGGISLSNGTTLKTFGFYFASGFGSFQQLRMHLRDSSGNILATNDIYVTADFTGGWVYWENIDYTITSTASYIVTAFVYDSSGTNINASIRAEVSTGSNPAGFAYSCTGTTNTYMTSPWTNWAIKGLEWDFWYRAYGD